MNGLYKAGELLSPTKPTSAFVSLALGTFPKEITGKYVDWNDSRTSKRA